MKSIFVKNIGLGLMLASAISIVACSPTSLPNSTIGVPSNSGTQKASITGSVVKADRSAARNATLVLIQKVNGTDKDIQIVRSDDSGQYRFNDVPAGEYRLAFVLQSEDERKNKTTKYYDPEKDPQSTQYFSFMTTGTFPYDGKAGASYQVPQMNLGWISSLDAHGQTFGNNSPISFNWNAVEGAKSYYVDIRDSNNNPFYNSGEITGSSFSWTDLKGNQGSNKGVALKSGTYYYIINAKLDRTASGDGPTPNYGGTALATFTVR